MKVAIMMAAALLLGCSESHRFGECIAPHGKWNIRASDDPSCAAKSYTVDLDHDNAASGCVTDAEDFDDTQCILTTRGTCSASTFVTVLRFNAKATRLLDGTLTVEADAVCDYEVAGERWSQ